MILFVYWDESNTAGQGYYVLGSAQGAYDIHGDKAISHDPLRDTTVKDIRDRLS